MSREDSGSEVSAWDHGNWSFRPATPADLDDVVQFLAAAGLPPDELEKQFGPAYVLAFRDGRLEGVAGLEVYGRHGFLRSVAVTANARGSGLGRSLVNDRLHRARRLGLESVHLLTMSASRWFERLGFEVIDRSAAPFPILDSSQFTTSCPSSAVLMKCTVLTSLPEDL
jgi:N-acetylglutamate synthase-like GNAT family acetyltransferase